MDTARVDALATRDHLHKQGWIAPRNESFRHLPPPGIESWLQGPADGTAPGCDAPPLAVPSAGPWSQLSMPGGGRWRKDSLRGAIQPCW